jgi:tetratricopeptide (TPR) repeat protein
MNGGLLATGSPEEQRSVRHLEELGYVDPLETATRNAMLRRAQDSQLNQARELLDSGDVDAAIGLLERAADASPAWTAGRHMLARAQFRAGRVDAALELLDWLQWHAVEHAELALMRAQIALKRRSLDEALEWAAYAKFQQTTLPEADIVVGEARLRRGHLAEAEQAFAAAAKHGSSAAEAGMAAVALRRHKFELAVEHSLNALEKDMGAWPAHYRLGLALFKMQRWSEAKIALETAARLNPATAGPYRWLAHMASMSGDFVGSERYRQLASTVRNGRRADFHAQE